LVYHTHFNSFWIKSYDFEFNPSPGDGDGAKAFSLGSKEISLDTNEPSVRSAHYSIEAPNAPFSLLSESLLSKGKYAVVAPKDPTPTSALHKCQTPSTQAATARSNGEPSKEHLQWPSPPSSHREASTQSAKEATGAQGNCSHSQVFPKTCTPLSRIPELFLVVAGKGQSSKFRGSTAERKVARGGLLAKKSDPSKRQVLQEVDRPSLWPLHLTVL